MTKEEKNNVTRLSALCSITHNGEHMRRLRNEVYVYRLLHAVINDNFLKWKRKFTLNI